MIKIVTIIGARPQIIKAAAISRAIKNNFANAITEIIVHTGQHYDENMSQVFIKQMDIPEPKYNLNVGSGTHGKMTALMIEGIEKILLEEKPDYLLVYGDTNSTLAGAIAASKIHVPIVHVEAGLRSYNKSMPEEINRIMCDHASTLLFSPTLTGYNNLLKEGFNENQDKEANPDNPAIYHCGDVMYDNSLYFADIAERTSSILKEHDLVYGKFILATIHRDYNTDNAERMKQLFLAFNSITTNYQLDVALPLHPRTNKLLEQQLGGDLLANIKNNPRIKFMPPVSFFDMIMLEKNSNLVMTDSGGVQKEAFYFQKPCIILRTETEWKEIVEAGTAQLCDANESEIIKAFDYFYKNKNLTFPAIFGDGNAAKFICDKIIYHAPIKY